jgi:hypothetical protein
MSDDIDPIDEVVFDEDFVRGARKHEPSAVDRYERALLARQAHESLLAQREADRRLERRFRRRSKMTMFVALLIVVSVLAWTIRARPGGEQPSWESSAPRSNVVEVDKSRPSPQPATSDIPLGVPPVVRRSSSAFAYVATQAGTDAPVAYDPCRPLAVVLNERTAPSNGRNLVTEAIASISAATGLTITIESTTDEVVSNQRAPFQLDRYGDRWAPILISWTDPVEAPDLVGDTAGFGGSVRETRSDGRAVYLTGVIALDGPQLDEILHRQNGRAQARSIILHELGHVVGLDHVDDSSQIMNPVGNPDVTSLQSGDLTGLAALGAGQCFDAI